MVSDPPRPSVVMFMVSFENPWKPATIAMLPWSIEASMRPGRHVDAGLAVHRRGERPACEPGERLGLEAQGVDRHRQQRHRDPLTGGEQHVELAALGHRHDLLGQVDQLVGGVTHRRDDHRDVVAGLLGVDDAFGDPLDPLGVGDGRAAVLLHDETHALTPFGRQSHRYPWLARQASLTILTPDERLRRSLQSTGRTATASTSLPSTSGRFGDLVVARQRPPDGLTDH